MQQWIQVFENVVDSLLKHPGSPLEKWVLIISGCLFSLWVYARTGSALGIPNPGGFRCVFTAALGLALVLAAMTAVKVYFPGAVLWILISVPVIAVLIIVLPLTCLIQRAGYLTAFVTWLISFAALAAIILLISAGFDAFSSGSQRAEKSRMHKQELEQFIGERK